MNISHKQSGSMFGRQVKKEFPAVIVFTSLKYCVKFA